MLACALSGCTEAAAAQWLRRPTADELAPIVAAEEAWRQQLLAASDPAAPQVFGPLPDATTVTVPVYACRQHAIGLDLAALVHQSTCTAPVVADLPGCDCTPEQPAVSEPLEKRSAESRLPAHWIAP